MTYQVLQIPNFILRREIFLLNSKIILYPSLIQRRDDSYGILKR